MKFANISRKRVFMKFSESILCNLLLRKRMLFAKFINKMLTKRKNILAAFTQRRKMNFNTA